MIDLQYKFLRHSPLCFRKHALKLNIYKRFEPLILYRTQVISKFRLNTPAYSFISLHIKGMIEFMWKLKEQKKLRMLKSNDSTKWCMSTVYIVNQF